MIADWVTRTIIAGRGIRSRRRRVVRTISAAMENRNHGDETTALKNGPSPADPSATEAAIPPAASPKTQPIRISFSRTRRITTATNGAEGPDGAGDDSEGAAVARPNSRR